MSNKTLVINLEQRLNNIFLRANCGDCNHGNIFRSITSFLCETEDDAEKLLGTIHTKPFYCHSCDKRCSLIVSKKTIKVFYLPSRTIIINEDLRIVNMKSL